MLRSTSNLYTISWEKDGGIDSLTLSGDCNSLSGKNQYDTTVTAHRMFPNNTIIYPTAEELATWITLYENAPDAPGTISSISENDETKVPKIKYSQAGAQSDSFSLLPYLQYSPIERNQGVCGDCWQWAGTAIMEIQLAYEKNIKDRLSIEYLNSNIESMGERKPCCGGWLDNVTKFYIDKGQAVPWSNANADWQDGSCGCGNSVVLADSISTTPSYSIAYIKTEKVPTHSVGADTAISNIKSVLRQGKAVWLAIFLPNDNEWANFRNFWNNKPEETVYQVDSASGTPFKDGGGHAVVIVGYNDTDPNNRYWIVLNSWGTAKGLRPNGLFRVNMDMNYDCQYPGFMHNYALLFETLDVTYSNKSGNVTPFPPNNVTTCPLCGWLSDKDVRLTGDFMGTGRDQILIINRDPVGHVNEGKIGVFELEGTGSTRQWKSDYWESYGDSEIFDGWIDDEDMQIAGDFLGRGYDQVMFISREPMNRSSPYFGNANSIMIADFKSGKPPAEVVLVSKSNSMPVAGWLSDKDVRLAGDFMGTGKDQILIINRDPVGHANEGKIGVFEVEGTGSSRLWKTDYWENYGDNEVFDGWIDDEDLQAAGDFLGSGYDQVMFISREPMNRSSPYFGNANSIMIADFKGGKPPAEVVLVSKSNNKPVAGWLSDKDVRLTGDFMGAGKDQILIINRDPVGAANEGKIVVLEVEGTGSSRLWKYDYWENYGDNEVFDGWIDDEDLQTAGDFLGRGYDQVMFISREPMNRSSPYFGNKARIIFADFSGGVPAEVIAESMQAGMTGGEAA